MRYIPKTALIGYFRNGLIRLHQLLCGVVEAVFNNDFHKGFAGYFLKIFAKRVGGHVGNVRSFV